MVVRSAQSPETQVITPVDEIDKLPVPAPDDPSLPVQKTVNVPSGSMVSESLSHQGAPGPEAKPAPCHTPAKSAKEYEAACLVKTKSWAS
jgi:hypothetical protein